MGMEKVPVNGHTTKVLTLNFDMPTELADALTQHRTSHLSDTYDPITEVVITIGGVRIGKVNMHSREWERRGLLNGVESY